MGRQSSKSPRTTRNRTPEKKSKSAGSSVPDSLGSSSWSVNSIPPGARWCAVGLFTLLLGNTVASVAQLYSLYTLQQNLRAITELPLSAPEEPYEEGYYVREDYEGGYESDSTPALDAETTEVVDCAEGVDFEDVSSGKAPASKEWEESGQ